ncbi:hypothetical protein [Streptomyces sp. CA-132043]|uniref:hypothetical protein n=1 Tax=Streptomyces sp. CA-132043 TaxID=3240048 RepID=UPI003D8D0731
MSRRPALPPPRRQPRHHHHRDRRGPRRPGARPLTAAERATTVLTGDGTVGHPDHAPYDRGIATYTVHTVPHAWIQQTHDRGIVVTPWATAAATAACSTSPSTTTPPRPRGPAATGTVTGDSAFMRNREQAPDRDVMAAVHDEGHAHHSQSPLAPRRVLGAENMAFTAVLLVPDTRYSVGPGSDPGDEFALWLAHIDTSS